jgi:hypothetical protein
MISKSLRKKKYFQEGVLLYGILARAKGEGIPRLLRNTVPSDLLPWWPRDFRRHQRFGRF